MWDNFFLSLNTHFLFTGLYIVWSMGSTVVIIIVTISALHMGHNSGENRMPRWLRICLFDVLSKCICRCNAHDSAISMKDSCTEPAGDHMQNPSIQSDTKSETLSKSNQSAAYRKEWKEGANILERFFSYSSLIMLVIATPVSLVVLPRLSAASHEIDLPCWLV